MSDLVASLAPLGSSGNAPPRMQRARGRARIAFRLDGAVNRLAEFYQQGCCKIRLPRVEPGLPPEAVLLNTSGGITGGDHLEYEVEIGAGGELVVTTQAAERIYRSSGGFGLVANRLAVGAGARLDWLPQETILFDRSALKRSLDVDLAADASAVLVETFIFGRGAMGEIVNHLSLADRWRVRRDGQLIYADGVSVEGDASATLRQGATGFGASAVATLVFADPDAPSRLDEVRGCLAGCRGEVGASAWPGILNVRFVAASGQSLRHDVGAVVECLRRRAMPRVWHC